MCSVNGFQMSHCMARMSNHKIKKYDCFIEYYLNPSKYFWHPEMGNYEQKWPVEYEVIICHCVVQTQSHIWMNTNIVYWLTEQVIFNILDLQNWVLSQFSSFLTAATWSECDGGSAGLPISCEDAVSQSSQIFQIDINT